MKQKALLLFVFFLLISNTTHSTTQKSVATNDVFVSENIFNDLSKPEYAQEILPNDFSHLSTLLNYCQKSNKSRIYVERIFRVFNRLLKGAHYVNAYAFSELLNKMPDMLEQYFTVYHSRVYAGDKQLLNLEPIDRFKEVVNRTLYSRFLSDYNVFKKDTDTFFDKISTDIFQVVEEESTIDQLRQTIIRFLETGLSKLVWSPENHEYIWQSIKGMSFQITNLMEHYVIDDADDINDLFWTLIHRFCFFLDLTGATLPSTFFNTVKQDITHQSLDLLELEEQEPWLETKASCLKRSLFSAQARNQAYKHGILTQ